MSTGDYQTAERMAVKFAAVPLPDLEGRTVLDVGCDHGAWCWRALELGASRVLGLDRGRHVPGEGFVNLAERNSAAGVSGAEFREFELGRQWHDFGHHDVVLLLNVYHHAYQACGSHDAVWYWLWRHTAEALVVELPLDRTDGVVTAHVTHPYHEAHIRAAAEQYFDVVDVGPGWVPTRRVWRCYPRTLQARHWAGKARAGAGGASKAFLYADGRRMDEFQSILGVRPVPGSLNVHLTEPFDWESRYYRAQLLDVVDRSAGLDSAWQPRWARIYPLAGEVFAFRFEGETYQDDFVELIAGRQLRADTDVVVLEQC